MKKYNKNALRKLQLTELEILKEIDRVCKKNKINYCLVGGTLLGAVRHNGFIPWDDDIDIAMLREDYEKFCDICNKELGDNYYLHSFKDDKKYWLTYSKIRKKNTILDEKNIAHLKLKKEIFVDVFPIDSICNRKIKFRAKIIKKIQMLLLYKVGLYNKSNGQRLLKVLLEKFINNSWLHKICLFFMTRDKNKNPKLLVSYGSIYEINKEIFEKDDYVPFKKIKFEGYSFPVPNKYKKVLSQVYGKDYMELPPVEKRITHNPVKISFNINDENETYYG